MKPVVVTHNLPLDRLRPAAERIAGDLQQRYGGSWEWVAEHALQFRHQMVAGTLCLFGDRVELAINLGPALRLFASRIHQGLTTEIAARLHEAAQ